MIQARNQRNTHSVQMSFNQYEKMLLERIFLRKLDYLKNLLRGATSSLVVKIYNTIHTSFFSVIQQIFE